MAAYIVLSINSGKYLGTKEKAEHFFDILEKYDITPDKIGEYEPLREEYSRKAAVEMWTKPGGSNPLLRAGSMIGKKKEPNVREDILWFCGENARPAYITLWFTKKSFKQKSGEIESIFKDMILLLDAFYGNITCFDVKYKQHVTGTIETRIPGVFWCNFFGQPYVDFFGKEKLLNAPWHKTEVLKNHGIITYLAKDPDKELLESDTLAMQMQEYLGKNSFGDLELYRAQPTLMQQRDVPKLDLSEIRKPVSEYKFENH